MPCKCKHWNCYVCATQDSPRFSIYKSANTGRWFVTDHHTFRRQAEGLTRLEAETLAKHLNNEGK